MKTLLWWMEPVEHPTLAPRNRLVDYAIAFGVSAVLGLGFAGLAGPSMRVPLGSAELSLPRDAWQYGVWLLVFAVGGALGAWIMSFGGRAQVSLREDGIERLIGRATRYFYAYSRMQRCELVPAPAGSYRLLRITLKPERAGEPAPQHEVALSKRIDANRVREILRAAGVDVAGSTG